MLDWRPFFPLERPRPEQATALDQLCQSIVEGSRTLVAELGTGVGKSAVAVTLARWLAAHEAVAQGFSPGAVVLTSQKTLQDQYTKDFGFARDIRSAANFPCDGPIGGTCAETSRVRKAVGKELAQKLVCGSCPYRAMKEAYASAQLGVTNYSYFLSETVYAQELPLRQLLILDEAHNIEDEVRRWASVEVSEAEAAAFKLELPRGATEEQALEWLDGDFKAKVEARLERMGGKFRKIVERSSYADPTLRRMAQDHDRLDKRKCQINRLLSKAGRILVSFEEERVRFQPLDVGELAQEILYSKASACLLMSATLLDWEFFRKTVGLPTTARYVGVPSPFKPEAFGVRFRPIGKMTRDEIDQALQFFPYALRKVLADHPNEKGIIHTTNYRITREVEKLRDRRLLIQASSADREGMLRRHLESPEPTVLVSPSMMEGLDLKGDLGRFQVVCKMPYPNLSDPVAEAKGWEWMQWRAARALVQAVGRCVRSETDWTRTYILDGSFVTLRQRASLPPHLKRGVVEEQAF